MVRSSEPNLTSSPETLSRRESADEEPPSKRQRLLNGHTTTQSLPDFKPGALIRIRMQNFMTYDDITYHFGPALNMIIGPNGSGKSTVVAGICLGLGFEPKIMGRASHLNDTIKHGTQTANLEIELKGHGESNVIIARQFSHGEAGTKSTNEWHVNGRRSTHKNVMDIVRGYNCQIDNLCQFLPQDKVASFARMKPVEMLAETLRTVGDGALGALQTELIELQGKQKIESSSRKNDAERLKSLKERQDVLRRDVERFQERQEHQKAIDLRKMRLPFARYAKAREEVHIARDEYKAIKEELYNLKRANQPLEVQEDSLSNAVLLAEKQATRCKQKLDASCRQLDRHQIPLKHAESDMKKLEQDHKHERDAEKRNKQELRALQEQVAQMTHSVGSEPDDKAEIALLTEQIQGINSNQRRLQVESDTIEQFLDDRQSERDRLKRQLEVKENELLSLNDFRTQRLKLLREKSPDAFAAVQWLKENADKFEHRVYPPVLLEVQVTQKRYAKAAQHVIMQNAFTFTCLSRSDYTKFNELLVDGTAAAGRRLRLNVSEYSRTAAPTLRDQRSPLTKAEVSDFGFDGYLLDVLDGPDAVLNTLCHAAQVHNLPVGSRELNQHELQNIENAQRHGRPLFSRYISGETDTKIFRGYGQTSSASESISNPGNVFSAASDPQKEQALRSEVDELLNSLNSDVDDLRQKAGRLQELKAERSAIDERKKIVQLDRENLTKRHSDWTKNAARVRTKKAELDRRLNAPAEYQDNIARIRAEQIQKTKHYTELVFQYKTDLLEARSTYEKYLLSFSALLQTQADKGAFDAHNSYVRQTILDAEKMLEERKRIRDTLTDKAKAIHKIASDAVAQLTEAERDAVNDFPAESTPEDIEAEIEDYQTRLNILAETSGDVVGQYEAREREITALQATIDNHESAVEELTTSIRERHASFETQLETMRKAIDESFGQAFHSINCLGEIRIGKPESYENWSLEIWVQFRNEDPMSLLTGERQSGGERAVSTIFYLMALQSLSIAPFRVVDEINQGMDARNERQVHARMVQVACEINTSQYFLITPKLLSDLNYHRFMKVHCVTSGNLGRAGNRIGYPKYLAALKARKFATQSLVA